MSWLGSVVVLVSSLIKRKKGVIIKLCRSALFVVDLVRFRRQKAGDLLRAAYMTLSQDRNSLANLDQDLPNFAQHEIPIFPLPQQWLWCETWCSKETLATAKTIDLCNNPMTKEPKLSQARRLIPEWVTYDQVGAFVCALGLSVAIYKNKIWLKVKLRYAAFYVFTTSGVVNCVLGNKRS